ncbi:MAG: transcriptional regulator [Thermoprotei archaeon]|nr:transcriptional regulator [Thermoprotei archaeon]
MEGTLRKRITAILEENEEPLTVDDIITRLGLRPYHKRLVYGSLSHIAKSIRRSGGILMMRAPYCLNCGYVFTDLKRIRKPSRCPRCKSERIAPPTFMIKRRG